MQKTEVNKKLIRFVRERVMGIGGNCEEKEEQNDNLQTDLFHLKPG